MESSAPSSLAGPSAPPPKLLDQIRARNRRRNFSFRTEQAYVDWARRFNLVRGKRHPREMGAAEVEAFLSHLATERGVSASTQNQAKAALLFLYKEVLGIDLPWLAEIVAGFGAVWLPDALAVKYKRSEAGRAGERGPCPATTPLGPQPVPGRWRGRRRIS